MHERVPRPGAPQDGEHVQVFFSSEYALVTLHMFFRSGFT